MYQSNWKREAYVEFGFGLAAAALLAIDHFNDRSSLVVRELGDLASCPVQFTDLGIIDSQFDNGPLFDEMVERVHDERLPCAVLGPSTVQPALEVQKLLSRLDIPQLLYSSFDRSEAFGRKYPTTMTASVSQDTHAQALVDLFSSSSSSLPPSIFAITGPHTEENFPAKYLRTIVGDTVRVRREDARFLVDNFRPDAVQEFKESGYRVLLISYDNVGIVADLARILDEAGLLTPDYQYIIPNTALMFYRQSGILETLGPTHSLYKFLNGAMSVDMLDGFDWRSTEDPFLRTWKSLDASFVQRVLDLAPPGLNISSDFFQRHPPTQLSSYVYDNVMALGLGACHMLELGPAERQQQGPPPLEQRPTQGQGPPPPRGDGSTKPTPENFGQGSTRPPPVDSGGSGTNYSPEGTTTPTTEPPQRYLQDRNEQDPPPKDCGPPPEGREPPPDGAKRPPCGPPKVPEGLPIIDATTNITFGGATGMVSFDSNPRPFSRIFRRDQHCHIGLYQLQATEETGRLEVFLVRHWTGDDKWMDLTDGKTLRFRDGSSFLSEATQVARKFNYLSTSVRIFGLSLMAFAWLLSFATMVMILIYRQKRNVRAAQPFFMILLCIGSIVTSSTIFPLSFDENTGWTDSNLDVACSTTPFLFFLGQIIGFSAIFSKLMRVDRVMQFRRQAVMIRHVVWPLLTLLALALGFLVAWTVVDPLTWERHVIRENPLETYGECSNENFWIYFGPLMTLLVVSQIATGYFTWRTMDVAAQFRDPEVMYVLLTNTQAWMVGVPLLSTMGTSSSDATYLGRIFLISIFAFSSVGFVVIPKVVEALRELNEEDKRIHVSGLAGAEANPSPDSKFESGKHLRRPLSRDSAGSHSAHFLRINGKLGQRGASGRSSDFVEQAPESASRDKYSCSEEDQTKKESESASPTPRTMLRGNPGNEEV